MNLENSRYEIFVNINNLYAFHSTQSHLLSQNNILYSNLHNYSSH